MAELPRIGVLGAGAVGCYVGGKLLAAGAAEVVLVGRPATGDELRTHGLTVKDFDRPAVTVPADRITYAGDPSALAGCRAILCCVKSAQTDEAAASLAPLLAPGAVVASLQNGVRNAETLRRRLAGRRVLAGIVTFNVVARGGGVFHRATDGPLVLEAAGEPSARALIRALAATDIGVTERADLAPEQWTKLLINLNNAISALSGAPTRAILLSPGYRRVVAALLSESLGVLKAAGIKAARFRGMPLGVMPPILRMPTPLVRLVTSAQMKVDPEARSSMWQDLSRGRVTEVDYLNGEIVRLAEQHGRDAPLNRRIVALVHDAERRGPGSPELSADALWSALQERAT
jgi:2-dehydropantoate 2-reductase